ncbi:unnamed protein product, partial [Choristocarpus tenellus]
KVALRAASLRWHPDKFLTKYGPRLLDKHRDRIVQVVISPSE